MLFPTSSSQLKFVTVPTRASAESIFSISNPLIDSDFGTFFNATLRDGELLCPLETLNWKYNNQLFQIWFYLRHASENNTYVLMPKKKQKLDKLKKRLAPIMRILFTRRISALSKMIRWKKRFKILKLWKITDNWVYRKMFSVDRNDTHRAGIILFNYTMASHFTALITWIYFLA